MKKLVNLLCLAACVLGVTACSTNESTTIDVNVDEYKNSITADLQLLSDHTDEELLQSIADNEETGALTDAEISLFNSWIDTRSEVGSFVAVNDWAVEVNDDTIILTAKVDYSDRDADYRVGYSQKGVMQFSSFNVQYTLAEKMTKALLNTVIGMGVVFVVLIMISLLIGCFQYIGKIEQALKNKKENKSEIAAKGVDNTIAQINQKEEEELVDDLELVAVISAAIAAYTGSSTDGFVVRSIKKSNKKNWKNA